MGNKITKNYKFLTVVVVMLLVVTSAIFLTSCTDKTDFSNIESIAIKEGSLPDVAIVGEFDITSIILEVKDKDGEVTTVNAQSAMLTNEAKKSFLTEGEKNFTITYAQKTINATITLLASGTETVTVTFVDDSGKQLSKKTIAKGGSVEELAAPKVDDMTFVGWVNKGEPASFTNIVVNTIFTPEYKNNNIKECDVTFYYRDKDNKKIEIETVTVNSGSKVAIPSFTAPAGVTSVKWGWDFSEAVTDDMEIGATLTYESRTITYAYVFIGNTSATPVDLMKSGKPFSETIFMGEHPEKLEDAKRSLTSLELTFVDWHNLQNVKEGTTNTLIAVVQAKTVNISFKNGDFADASVEAGEDNYTMPATTSVTIDGMFFNRVWKDKDGKEYKAGETYTITKDLVLESIFAYNTVETTFKFTFKQYVASSDEVVNFTYNKSKVNDNVSVKFIKETIIPLVLSDNESLAIANYGIERVEYFDADTQSYVGMENGGFDLINSGTQNFNVVCIDVTKGSSGLSYAINTANSGYIVSGYTSSYSGVSNVYIPEVYNDGVNGEKPVVAIGDSAFANKNIYLSNIPSSVVSIGASAFSGAILTQDLAFGAIAEIGANAFYEVTGEVEGGIKIDLSNATITELADDVFSGHSGIREIVFSDTLVALGENSLKAKVDTADLTMVNLGGIKKFGNGALANNAGLTELSLTIDEVLGLSVFDNMSGLVDLTIIADVDTAIEFNLELIDSLTALKTLSIGNGFGSISGAITSADLVVEVVSFGKDLTADDLSFVEQMQKVSTISEVVVDSKNDSYKVINGALVVVREAGSVTTNTLVYYPTSLFGNYEVSNEDVVVINENAFNNVVLNKLSLEKVTDSFSFGESGSYYSFGGNIRIVSMTEGLLKNAFYNNDIVSASFEGDIATIFGADVSLLIVEATQAVIDDMAGFDFVYFDAKDLEGDYDSKTGLYYSLEKRVLGEKEEHVAFITGGDTAEVDMVIPSEVAGYRVVGIKAGAFVNYTNMVTLDVKATLEKLGSGVFDGCVNLESVKIAKIENSVSSDAFDDTAWANSSNILVAGGKLVKYNNNYEVDDEVVTIVTEEQLAGITSIPNNFFMDSNLTSIELPDSVTKIGDYAFQNSALKHIDINNVVELGIGAFKDCASLENFAISGTGLINNGTLFAETFANCSQLSDVSFVNKFRVVSENAFANCSSILYLVFVDGGVIEIGESAFSGCDSITNITISQNVTKISNNAFANCASLKSVEFIGTQGVFVTEDSIGNTVFDSDLDMVVKVHAGVLAVAKSLFGAYFTTNVDDHFIATNITIDFEDVNGRSLPGMATLSSLYIESAPVAPVMEGKIFESWYKVSTTTPAPYTLTADMRIVFPLQVRENIIMVAKYYEEGKGSLSANNLVEVENGYKLVSIDDNTVDKFYLPSVFVDGENSYNIVSVDLTAFEDCANLKELSIPEGVVELVGTLGANSGIELVNIAQSVESISDMAFNGATEVDLAFAENANLLQADISSFEGSKWYDNALASAISNSDYGFVMAGNLVLKFVIDPSYSGFIDVTIPGNAVKLGAGLFKDNQKLRQVSLNNDLQYIGDECFMNATELRTIIYTPKVDSKLVNFGARAFDNTYWLKNQDMAIIGNHLLNYRENGATTVAIPDYIKVIKEGAFDDATMKSVTFNSGSILTTIEDYAFANCSKLESIVLPRNLDTLGEGVFVNCILLKTADLSNTKLVSLSDDTFKNCERLAEVKLSETTQGLGEDSLFGCSNLEQITAEGLVKIDTLTDSGLLEAPWYTTNNATDEAEFKVLGKILVKYNGVNTITKVVVPNGVEAIYQQVFANSNIVKVTLPNSLMVIGASAFYNCTQLEVVELGSGASLQVIEKRAFSGCSSLVEIELVDTIESIEDEAFYSTNISDIVIPDSVVSIGERAFSGMNSLLTITLGTGIESIEESAFAQNNELYKVNWLNATVVEQIGAIYDNFEGANYNFFVSELFKNSRNIRMYVSNITRVAIQASDASLALQGWSKINNSDVNFDLIAVIDGSDDHLPEVSFDTNSDKGAYIKDSFKTELIESIDAPVSNGKTFMGWYLDAGYATALKLPYLVKENTKLFAKWFDNEINTLNDPKISVAGGLITDIKLAEDVLYIPNKFNGTVVTGFGDAITRENAEAVKTIVFTNGSNINIAESNILKIFTNLEEIKISNLGEEKFVVQDGVTAQEVLVDGLKTTVEYNHKVVLSADLSVMYSYIGLANEDGSKATSFVVPKTVTTIVEDCFANSMLTSIEISDRVQNIYAGAFNDEVQGFTFKAKGMINVTKESFNNTDWWGSEASRMVYAPNGSAVGYFYSASNVLLAYDATTTVPTLEFPTKVNGVTITVIASEMMLKQGSYNSIVLPEDLVRINEKAFLNMDFSNVDGKVKDLEFIADNVFGDTTYLLGAGDELVLGSILLKARRGETNYVVDEDITAIANGAFIGNNLKKITLPEDLEIIGANAFLGCSNLENVVIPDKVVTIGSETFRDCKKLNSVTFGADSELVSIGVMAFADCKALTRISIPYTVTNIEEEAFARCSGLENILFNKYDENGLAEDSMLVSLGDSAFSGCSSLKSIEIPNSLSVISDSTFLNCTSLVSVTMHTTRSKLEIIEESAFQGCSSLGSIISVENPTLDTMVMPNKLKVIKDYAFAGCSGMYGIVMNESLSKIGEKVFLGAINLAKLTFPSRNPPEITSTSFSIIGQNTRDESNIIEYNKNARYNLRIYVEMDSMEYKGATLIKYNTEWSKSTNVEGMLFERGNLPSLTYQKNVNDSDLTSSDKLVVNEVEVIVNPSTTFGTQSTFSNWLFKEIGDVDMDAQVENKDPRLGNAVDSAEYRKQPKQDGSDGMDVILVVDTNITLKAALSN